MVDIFNITDIFTLVPYKTAHLFVSSQHNQPSEPI